MTIEVKVTISQGATQLKLPDNEGELTIYTKEQLPELNQANLYLYFKQRYLVGASYKELISDKLRADEYDEVILVELPWELEDIYFMKYLNEQAQLAQFKLITSEVNEAHLPQGIRNRLAWYYQEFERIVTVFGFKLSGKEERPQTKPTKARHRWRKEISEMDFFIDSRQSQATLRWQKRNELLIKAGAVMKSDLPLNKDGSVGFAAKMGEKIRSDYQDSFKNFVTTEDIILKSVNEVGLFLYFGGTNSWLEIQDKTGKTIHEWTVEP